MLKVKSDSTDVSEEMHKKEVMGKKKKVMYRWDNHVEPAFKKYVKPYRKTSDIVIPNNIHFEKDLNFGRIFKK